MCSSDLFLFFLSCSLVFLVLCLASFAASLALISALADSVVRTDSVESITRFFFFLALLSAAPLQSSVFSSCSISIPSSIESIWLINFLITILIALEVVSK